MKFLYLALALSTPAFAADPCLEIRGSVDLHGTNSRALAALVDTCKKEVLKTIFEAQAPNTFDDAAKTADKKISPELLSANSAKVKELVDHMKEKGAQHILVLAGEAFRTAPNGAEAATQLSGAVGAPVRVLQTEEESQLFYLAGLAAHHVPITAQDGIAVWRIGDNGMILHAESGETQDYRANIGSDAFAQDVLHDVLKKEGDSPNPLGNAWHKAVSLAQKDAKEVPAYFRKKKGPRRWLAIGDVLAVSVQNQVKKKGHSFTATELEATLKKRSAWKDEKFGGEHPANEATNLALVLGYMKALGIKKVETASSSLNQGLLLLQLFNPMRDEPTVVPGTETTPTAASGTSTSTASSTSTATNKE